MEVTDASTTTEKCEFFPDACRSIFFNSLIYLVFYPPPDFYLRQILLEETLDSPLSDPAGAEDDLVAVHTQAVDSPARQITDGEGVTCSICSFATNMN